LNVIEKELDHLWVTTLKPAIMKCITRSDKENIKPQAQFDLSKISWKIRGGNIVTHEVPVWGTAFAYTKKGKYHVDLRGELVRYLEYYGRYIHHENGETWDVTLNNWRDNTFLNVRKQKHPSGVNDG